MSNSKTREKYIVCCALPYANGPLHIGHLAGAYIPGDVYARYKRLQGHDVHFLCGSDEHGAAITFLALRENTTPQAVVDKYHEVLKRDLEHCDVKFDVFSRTTHPCHIKRSQEFFLRNQAAGLIERRSEQRLYCQNCQIFLPDRYVVGECPSCHAAGARGDQCEKCGTWYEPEALINPICQVCKKTKATLKETFHWYFCLDKLEEKLKSWLEGKSFWRRNVLGYAFQPIQAGLAPRSITRDLTWGVPVPDADAQGKVLYVWFDAPIGYISASEDWGLRENEPDRWKKYWEDKSAKLVHFIGKDNIVFHTVVWPAILLGDGRYPLPYLVAGNEFLNLEGEKISTSRNFAIWAQDAVNSFGADALRFYLTRISPESSDANFTWLDFQNKINSELADAVGNLANRSLSFLNVHFAGELAPKDFKLASDVEAKIRSTYDAYCQNLDLGLSKLASDAMLELARFLNGYFQAQAPWKQIKSDRAEAQLSLANTCVGLKAVTLMLYSICPSLAQRMWEQFGFADRLDQHRLEECFDGFAQGQVASQDIKPLVKKIEDAQIAQEKHKLDEILAKR